MIFTLNLPVTGLVHIAEYPHLFPSSSLLMTEYESGLRKSTSTHHHHAPQKAITKHIKQSCHHAVIPTINERYSSLHDRPILIIETKRETNFHKPLT